jgi:hypothetical protein
MRDKRINFETADIVKPLVCGTVGFELGTAMLNFEKLWGNCPTDEEILANPAKVVVPEDPGIIYALTIRLVDSVCAAGSQADTYANKMGEYMMRWPAEQAEFALNRMENRYPRFVHSKAWSKWRK